MRCYRSHTGLFLSVIQYLLPPDSSAAGGICMKYSKSIRQEVFVKYVCGYTPKEIAKETGIHFVTIYRWVNSWRKNLNDRPLTSRFKMLEQFLPVLKN